MLTAEAGVCKVGHGARAETELKKALGMRCAT